MARFDTKSISSPALVQDIPLYGSNNKAMTPKDDNEETRRIRQTLQRWQTSASAVDALESTVATPDASLSPRRVRKVVGGGGATTVPISPMSVRKPSPSYRPMLPSPSPSPRYCPAPDSPHNHHGGFVRNQRRLSISSTRICANLASPISNTTTNRRSVMATMRGQSARGLSCRHLLD
jgi:hypothetical protein